jgi:hypothetical protein
MEDNRPPATGTNTTTDYSASKAPETHAEADEQVSLHDARLLPGGRQRARADIGMSAMDRGEVPSEGRSSGQTRYGDSPGGGE